MELDTGGDGHHQVTKYQIETLAAFESRQRLASAGQSQHLVVLGEQARHGFGDQGIVVDDQDPAAACGGGRIVLRGGVMRWGDVLGGLASEVM